MPAMLGFIVGSACGGASFWAGWTMGRRHEREDTRETLERIEPSSRTPGQPTNRSEPLATVRDPKRRPGKFNA